MKNSKRIVSLLLAVIMAFGAFGGINFNALAAQPDAQVTISSAELVNSKGNNIVQYTNGYFSSSGTNDHYYYYDLDAHFFNESSVINVKYSDGSVAKYVYDKHSSAFKSEANGQYCSIRFTSSQSENPLVLGENNVTVYFLDQNYKSIEFTIKVNIIESDIKSIKFNDPKSIDVTRGFNCIEEYADVPYIYYYDLDEAITKACPSITVSYKDTTKQDKEFCVYNWSENKYISSDGEVLDFKIDSTYQSRNPLQIGANEFPIYINGFCSNVQINLKDFPSSQGAQPTITYTPVDPIKVVENMNGYLDESGAFIYYEDNLLFRTGDALTINYNDGVTEPVVAYSNGDILFNEEYGPILTSRTSSQKSTAPWTVGGDNYFEIEFNGLTCKVPVEVVPNTYTKATIVCDPVEFPQFTNGYSSNGSYNYDIMDNFIERKDTKIVLTSIVDNVEVNDTFIYNNEDYIFTNGKGMTIGLTISDNLTDLPIGNHNIKVKVDDTALEADFGFTITPQYVAAKVNGKESYDYILNSYGYMSGDSLYCDVMDIFSREGTTLTTIDAENIEKTYTCTYDSLEDEYLYLDANGKELDVYFRNPWPSNNFKVGDTVYATAVISGSEVKIPVNVVETPIKQIDLIGVDNDTIEIEEYTNGYYNNYNGVYNYKISNILNAHVNGYKITYADGTSEILSNNDQELFNTLNTDKLPTIPVITNHSNFKDTETNNVSTTIYIGGFAKTVNINILPSTIKNIEYLSGNVLLFGKQLSYDTNEIFFESIFDDVKLKITYNNGESKIVNSNDVQEAENFEIKDNVVYLKTLNQQNKTLSIYYGKSLVDVSYLVEENEVDSFEIIKAPTKTEYVDGFGVNIDGAVIRINYYDGTHKDVTLTEDNIIKSPLFVGRMSYASVKGPRFSIVNRYEVKVDNNIISVVTVGNSYFDNHGPAINALSYASTYNMVAHDPTEPSAFILYQGNATQIPGLTFLPHKEFTSLSINNVKVNSQSKLEKITVSATDENNNVTNIPMDLIYSIYGEMLLDTPYGFTNAYYELANETSGEKESINFYSLGNIATFSINHNYDVSYEKQSDGTTLVAYTCKNCNYKYIKIMTITEGWFLDNGNWYYGNADGTLVINDWRYGSKGWYYLGTTGAMVTNDWVNDFSGQPVLLNDEGLICRNGWHYDGNDWVYLDADGHKLVSAWATDFSGQRVWLNVNGYITRNEWLHDGYDWFYLDADGRTTINAWVNDFSNTPVWVGSDGYITRSCWHYDISDWVYLGQNGHKYINTWAIDFSGQNVFVGNDGYILRNGWQYDGNDWFYVDEDGRPYTNTWVYDFSGQEVYLNGNGYITRDSWIYIDYDWAYLDADGRILRNGYATDFSGQKVFVGDNGYIARNGWQYDGIDWIYVDGDGRLFTKTWVADFSGSQVYLGEDGRISRNCIVPDANGNSVLVDEDGRISDKEIA